MHAILETGGKQYRVAPGDVIRVEKLAGDVGSDVELPAKAAFKDGGEVVTGGTVKATIVGAGRGIRSWSSSSRQKQYKKTIGHRQSFTDLIGLAEEAPRRSPFPRGCANFHFKIDGEFLVDHQLEVFATAVSKPRSVTVTV